MNEERPPREVGSNLLLGLGLDDRAAFEQAAEARGLPLARQAEWHRFEGMSENDRPYYNAKTDSAWWAWKTGREEERNRWRADLRLLADGHQAAAERAGDPYIRARHLAMADAMTAAMVIWA
jgi:hypothetical protein